MMSNNTEPILRRLSRQDAADVLAAFNSNPDMARQGTVTTLAEAEGYVQALLEQKNQEPWAIELDSRVIGLVSVFVDAQNLNGWFWYWMHQEARGQGWTGRAAATVASWALNVLSLERLELGHRVNNPASGGVAGAAGFVQEGTERGKFLIENHRVDVVTYGRLASDPVPDTEPLPMREPSFYVWQAERDLLTAGVRGSAERLGEYLADDFREIGQSGTHWTRETIIEQLTSTPEQDPGQPILDEQRADDLGNGLMLLTYRLELHGRGSRRSALWRVTDSGPELVFHQGTPLGHVNSN